MNENCFDQWRKGENLILKSNAVEDEALVRKVILKKRMTQAIFQIMEIENEICEIATNNRHMVNGIRYQEGRR